MEKYLILVTLIIICVSGITLRIGKIVFEFYPLKNKYRIFKQLKSCNPPNITYCKQAIDSNFNCKECKYYKN